MTFWKWSQTAATNATADTTINAREGQAPSTVNDAMRAMMAASAKYRDDTSGNLVTGGSSTAYTLTTNQTLTALTDGFAVTCRMSATNGASPTLNVDSLGAKSIAGVYGTAIPIGALRSGGVYTFVYDSTDDKWICHGLGPASHLTPTDGNIIVGDGSGWVMESGATARTSLGLGTGDSPTFTGLTLTSTLNIAANQAINFNSSDVTITHSSNLLTVAGGNLGVGVQSAPFRFVAGDNITDGGWIYSTTANAFFGLGGYANGTDGAAGLKYNRSSGVLSLWVGARDTLTDRITISATGVATFSASPIAPTPSAATQDTTIATTAFVWSTLGAPSGTKMVFNQTAAPTGWTKDTTHDNKALRLINGTVGSGGSTAFTSVFASRTIAEANLPSHTHTFSGTTSSNGAHTHFSFRDAETGTALTASNYPANDTTETGDNAYSMRASPSEANVGLTSSNGAHTHTYSGTTSAVGSGTAMDFAVQYVDVIIATRN